MCVKVCVLVESVPVVRPSTSLCLMFLWPLKHSLQTQCSGCTAQQDTGQIQCILTCNPRHGTVCTGGQNAGQVQWLMTCLKRHGNLAVLVDWHWADTVFNDMDLRDTMIWLYW